MIKKVIADKPQRGSTVEFGVCHRDFHLHAITVSTFRIHKTPELNNFGAEHKRLKHYFLRKHRRRLSRTEIGILSHCCPVNKNKTA